MSARRRGRPPGSRNRRTIIREIAGETHELQIDDRRARLSTVEIVLMRLRQLALENRPRARRAYFDLMEEYGPSEPIQPAGFLVVNELPTREEFIKSLEKLDAQQRERRRQQEMGSGGVHRDS